MTAARTILLVVAASAATGVVAWRLGAGHARPSAQGVSQDDFEALRQQVQTMDRERGRALVEDASRRARAPEAPAEPPRDPGATASSEPAPRKTAPTPEEVKAHAAQSFARFEEHFRAERRDEAWASETERGVADVVRDPALAFARVEQFHCAATLCKLEAAVANEDEFQGFAAEFGPRTTNLPSGSFRRLDDGHGGLKIEAYFAKKGSKLPRI